MNKALLFLPVNFSPASYKAIEYAILWAKAFGCRIKLFHVVDINDIIESDNQIVVNRHINHLIKKAEDKMQSFVEMVNETHGVTVESEVSLGRVEDMLLKEIENSKPDMIIIGKEGSKVTLLKSILSDIKTPVIVVPSHVQVNLPSRIVFSTDLKPVHFEDLKMLINMSQKSTKSIHLLHIQNMPGVNGKIPDWINGIEHAYNIKTEFHLEKYHQTVLGILKQISSESSDLLCTIRRQRNFIMSLFSNSISTQIAVQSSVPTLILPETHSYKIGMPATSVSQ